MIRAGWPLRLAALGVACLVAGCGASQGAPGSPGPASTPTGGSAVPASAGSASAAPAPSASAGSASAAPAVPASAGSASAAPASAGSASTACSAPATATTAQTEGPYFKAGSPEKASLVESGMGGTRVTFTGLVVTTACAPIPGVIVDIWQADASGAYDNVGYRLRGHVLTDAAGRFVVETIEPGEYPGRTEHIHVKLTPPGGATLTTQVYFPGLPANDADGIYSPTLLLGITPTGPGLAATFTFVLAAH